MSMIRKRLTEVAVDSFTDYLKEKIEEIKQLDLDNDGRKDVDQMKEIVESCGAELKKVAQSMDFQKLAAGLDQIVSGVNIVATAVDGNSLQAAGAELLKGLKKAGQLAQLAIDEAKDASVRKPDRMT